MTEPKWLKIAYMKIAKTLALGKNRRIRLMKYQQRKFVLWTTEATFEAAKQFNVSVGSIVYDDMPSDMAHIANALRFDPYNIEFTKESLAYWLEHHIVFDSDGYMAVLHDFGLIIWQRDDFKFDVDLLKDQSYA